MKLITRKNFISVVCISFTLIVMGKLIWEKLTGFTDANYTENIFICFGFSVIITIILAIHYYLQKYPFIPVCIGQYLVVIGLVCLGIWIMGHFSEIAPTAYRDMILSVTIPFVFCAIVYYILFFRQIRQANEMIDSLNGDGDEI